MASKALTALFLALMVASAMAVPVKTHTRRLLRGGNGGWDGGVSTEDIMSENDAIAGIDNAVNSDNFGATYSAAEGGYRDTYAATFPDDNNGQFWLSAGTQNTVGRR